MEPQMAGEQVRKLMMTTATLAALGLSAATAAAQMPANVTVQISSAAADYVYQATLSGMGGGGWKATITGLPTSVQITSPIVYCFDNQRQFNYNVQYAYKLLTFQQFVANVQAGPGGRSDQWNTMDLQDLNSMAYLASTYTTAGNNSSTPTGNNTIQTNIWTIGNNGTGTFTGDLSSQWLVLVDKAAWEEGFTAQQLRTGDKTWGSQSFLIQASIVPEPSMVVLLTVGLAGLGVTARRRRNKIS
jgi:hypothetical protein